MTGEADLDRDLVRSKHIAIVLPNLAGGGVERVRLLLAEQFLRKGFDVDMVMMQACGELLSEVPPGCRMFNLRARRFLTVPWHFAKYLRQTKPDVVLAAMWPLTFLAGVALRLARSPARLVVSEHNDFRKAPAIGPFERTLLRLLGRRLYARADAIVAVSRGLRDSLREVAGLPEEKVTVIYNPVRPLGPAEPPSSDHKLVDWWDQAAVKLIAVGSLKPQKDYATLLRALAIVRSKVDARLIILGEGAERTALEAQVEMEGLLGSVQLPGFRDSPYPYLMSADLFVLSSRWEGLGNVLTEALLCGCRAVSTDCPSGPSEILADGRYGKLVPVADEERLAAAIMESLTAPHDPKPGIEWASRFSSERVAETYLALLFPPAANKDTAH